MNDNQKKFLNEISAVFKKYAIDRVSASDSYIKFESNSEILYFNRYVKDCFIEIKTWVQEYEAEETETRL